MAVAAAPAGPKDKRISTSMSVAGEPRASEAPARASMFSQGSARDADFGEMDASGQMRMEAGGAEAMASAGAIEEVQVPLSQFKNMQHALRRVPAAVTDHREQRGLSPLGTRFIREPSARGCPGGCLPAAPPNAPNFGWKCEPPR